MTTSTPTLVDRAALALDPNAGVRAEELRSLLAEVRDELEAGGWPAGSELLEAFRKLRVVEARTTAVEHEAEAADRLAKVQRALERFEAAAERLELARADLRLLVRRWNVVPAVMDADPDTRARITSLPDPGHERAQAIVRATGMTVFRPGAGLVTERPAWKAS